MTVQEAETAISRRGDYADAWRGDRIVLDGCFSADELMALLSERAAQWQVYDHQLGNNTA